MRRRLLILCLLLTALSLQGCGVYHRQKGDLVDQVPPPTVPQQQPG